MSVNYLSATGYRTYRDCPQQYYYKYILRQKPEFEPQQNFLKGNALHHLMEGYIDGKEKRPDWFRENAPAYWNAELEAVAKNPRHTLEWGAEELAKHGELYLKWADTLAALFERYDFDPALMVSEFKADTYTEAGGVKFKMAGRVDVMIDTTDGGLAVLDLKASANKAITDYDQVVWYSHLAGLKLGKRVDYVGYILPAFDKVTLSYVPQAARDALMERVGKALNEINAGNLKPGDPQNTPCFFCDFKRVCPAQGGALEHKSGIVQFGPEAAGIDDLL